MDVFKQNYFRSPELKWRDASDLWSQPKRPHESVADYVVRMRKAAKRLEFPESVIHYAFLHGLRGNLRTTVEQYSVKTLQELIQLAKTAEPAIEAATDAIPAILMHAIKAHTDTAARQSDEIKQLTVQVAALTSDNTGAQWDAGYTQPRRPPVQTRHGNRALKTDTSE